MQDEITWLQLLARTESRIEDLFCSGRKYLPSVLAVNRELRDLILCILEDKDYFHEKMKARKAKGLRLTEDEITDWMYKS